jgi:hypothetical protein
MDPTSGPDLSEVNIASNPGCFSNSAQFIAAGMCLGHQNCTFHLDVNHTYTWEYNSKYGTECNEGWEQSDGSSCQQTLASSDFKSNFTDCPAGVTERDGQSLTVVGLCVDEELTVNYFGLAETTWAKEDIVTVIAYIDSGIIILFLFALKWLKKEEQQTIEESDATNCSPSDYTIQVFNLPNHKSIMELRHKLTEHFETVLTEDAKEDGVEGEDLGVFDIDFARNNGTEVYWKKRRGKIARRKDKLENEVYMLNEWGKYEGKKKVKLQTLHKYLHKQFEYCNGKLEAIEEKIALGKKKEYASSAFITFNTEEGYIRARKMYVDLGFMHRMCMPRKHRMANANGCRLIVRPAPEPSEIIWENLGRKWWARLLRLSFTSLITILLLAASFVLIFQSKTAQENAERKYPEADCSNYLVSTNTTLTKGSNPLFDPSGFEYLTPREVESDVLWEYYEADIGNTGKLECFCKALLIDPKQGLPGMYNWIFESKSWDNTTSPATTVVENEKWCKDWFTTYSYIQTLKITAVGGVVITNVLLKEILKNLISFEGHFDKTHEITSVTLKVFLATFVNTAFLTLLINGNLEGIQGSESKSTAEDQSITKEYGLLGGTYDDFGEAWYENIGVPIILTMIINMISPHATTIIQWRMKRFFQWRDRAYSKNTEITNQVTQDELEKVRMDGERRDELITSRAGMENI